MMAGWVALLAGQVLVAHSDKETEVIVVSTPYPSDALPLLSLSLHGPGNLEEILSFPQWALRERLVATVS